MGLTEQKIVEAAIAVFNDNPSANLEVVAHQAGVTRRTLHRYFTDRTRLLEACTAEMMRTCQAVMTAAYNSSTKPLTQLERMLYAAIDCNNQYAFLTKLQQRSSSPQSIRPASGTEPVNIRDQWFALIDRLQEQGLIDHQLTAGWIFRLFNGMIDTTIAALQTGDVAPNDIKPFAWVSFSRSIGVQAIRRHPITTPQHDEQPA